MLLLYVKKQELEEYKRDNYNGQYDYTIKLLEEEIRQLEGQLEKAPTKEAKTKDNELILPVCTGKGTLEIKSSAFDTYAFLVANSKLNPKTKENYIYRDEIEYLTLKFFEELKEEYPKGKIFAPTQIKKHITYLLKQDVPLLKVINTPNGVAYQIATDFNGKYFVLLPYIQLRELIVSTNIHMFRLFMVLKYKCNTDSFTCIDRKYFARALGLSDNNERTLDRLSIALTSLANLGFIEIEQSYRTEYINGQVIPKTINSYRITTLEEYKEAKKRGFVDRRKKLKDK